MTKKPKIGQVAYSARPIFPDMFCIKVGKIEYTSEENTICFEEAPIWYPLESIYATKKEAKQKFNEWLNEVK